MKRLTIAIDGPAGSGKSSVARLVAKKLGYGNIFLDESAAMEDDHQSFLKRNVPSVDVIDPGLGPGGDIYYWHTSEDTLDKISPKSLAITGHVFLESVKQLQGR